jgi:hypothetical protein
MTNHKKLVQRAITKRVAKGNGPVFSHEPVTYVRDDLLSYTRSTPGLVADNCLPQRANMGHQPPRNRRGVGLGFV